MKVWVVWFGTGEYEDREEHIDCLFTSKVKADNYAIKKRKELNKLGLHIEGDCSRRHDTDHRDSDAIRDKFGRIDYTGAWYDVSGPHEVKG
jgi:hypothetical protein